MCKEEIDIISKFHEEKDRQKFRKISKNWDIVKIEHNHIEAKNKMGGGVMLCEAGINRKITRKKMIVRIVTRKGIEKKKIGSDIPKLLAQMVNYMRSYPQN